VTPDKLSIERIQELYAQYLEQHFRDDWNKNYYEVVNRFRELSDDEFRLPENQEQLWRARGIANAGPGEAVSTVGAYSDIEIADALLAELRNENRPSDTELRAEEIQEAYERILALVHSRHSTNRPMIKLARAFAALLPHDSTVCLNWKSHDQLTALLLGPSKRSIQEAAVFSRSRLRQALGEEANLEEDVRRSIFCWWLTKNAVATDGDMQDPPSPVGKGGADSDDKKLVLYPISKQRKGVQAVAGYVDTHRLVVIAAQGGATADDIVESLHSDLTTYNHKSCRQLMSYVRSLGFLEYKDGLWYPSSDGEELVQSDPPNILVERLLIRNYGLAQLLRHIEANELSKKELYEKLKEQYPTWTGDFMPSSLLAWAYSLGLVHRDDGNTMRLTDYGQFWEMKLPTELPSPKIEPKTDELERVERHARPEPAIDEILSAFGKDEQLKAFVFGESEIRSIHAAWHSQKDKRFVIISGLSGTGKTALLLHYSRIYCELLELDPMVHRQLVAVSPDWRDPSGLLGYLNELQLDATFQPE
jgi:hypothetical protein